MRLSAIAISMSFLVAALTGCAGLETAKPELHSGVPNAGGTAIADGSSKVEIIFQPDRGQPERMERPLTESVTVQQLLVQSGAIKKYRRFEAEIRRQRPNGGGYFSIPCEYDRETRQIDPANDYALMPGDRLIVKEDTSTVIDDMMRSASGNLSKRFTTGGKHKTSSRFKIEG